MQEINGYRDETAGLLRMAVILACASIVFLFLRSVGELVKIVIISALLAYLIDPLAILLEARGMSRRSATVAIFLFGFLVLGILSLLFLPVLNSEISSLQEGLNAGEADVMISKAEQHLRTTFGFLGLENLQFSRKIHDGMVKAGDWVFGHILDLVAMFTNLVIIPFVVFFFLKDGRRIKKQFISMVPNRYFEFSLNMLYKMDLQLGNYLRGQFLDALIFGCLAVFTLWLLDVRYFLLIGTFSGMANLIPFLGPIAGVAPAVIVSVIDTGGFLTAGSIILAFAGLKLIDDILIQPLVVGRSVKMHPLIILLAVLAGGKLFGILGMILSVPVAGFLKIAVREAIVNFRRYHLA